MSWEGIDLWAVLKSLYFNLKVNFKKINKYMYEHFVPMVTL